MSYYSQQVGWTEGMTYVVLFPLAMCWRIFSNGRFWDALLHVGAVSLTATPAWAKFRPVMEMFRALTSGWIDEENNEFAEEASFLVAWDKHPTHSLWDARRVRDEAE